MLEREVDQPAPHRLKLLLSSGTEACPARAPAPSCLDPYRGLTAVARFIIGIPKRGQEAPAGAAKAARGMTPSEDDQRDRSSGRSLAIAAARTPGRRSRLLAPAAAAELRDQLRALLAHVDAAESDGAGEPPRSQAELLAVWLAHYQALGQHARRLRARAAAVPRLASGSARRRVCGPRRRRRALPAPATARGARGGQPRPGAGRARRLLPPRRARAARSAQPVRDRRAPDSGRSAPEPGARAQRGAGADAAGRGARAGRCTSCWPRSSSTTPRLGGRRRRPRRGRPAPGPARAGRARQGRDREERPRAAQPRDHARARSLPARARRRARRPRGHARAAGLPQPAAPV